MTLSDAINKHFHSSGNYLYSRLETKQNTILKILVLHCIILVEHPSEYLSFVTVKRGSMHNSSRRMTVTDSRESWIPVQTVKSGAPTCTATIH